MQEWYQKNVDDVRKTLNGHSNPLTSQEAKQHQEKYGKNELQEGKKKSVFQIFLEQYKDFLVIILIIAAIVSGFLGDFESAIVILIVITMNAILGTVQTVKAEQSLQSLKKLSAPEAKVVRDGTAIKVPASEVTVGDEVMLEAGDYVPADGRILVNASLKIDESALTGESLPVEKDDSVLTSEVPLGDRVNMVFSGSFVTYGRGSFIVTETGMNTEVGKIAGLLETAAEKKTPLQVSLDDFGKKLSIAILVFCGLLFGMNVLRGNPIGDSFLFAVALAVAAIPEALSSIVTIVLSFGTQKMAKEHAIIRKLQAVEGLGSVSIICSDKTGTLTQNKMTVEKYYVNGSVVEADAIDMKDDLTKRLMNYSILCNDATVIDGEEIGDPTETALVALGNKYGVDALVLRGENSRVAEVPFDSDRKLMSTVHPNSESGNTFYMITKGAVDVLLDRTNRIIEKDGIREITEEDKKAIEEQNQAFSRSGLRVLAFAYKEVSEELVKNGVSVNDEYDYTFVGLTAMMDPPRVESMAAVAECKKAGIRPIMITGDHKVTAAAIAKRIGILENESEACEGAVIDPMSDEELKDFVEGISVYARVSPEHKIRIVKAWQEKGNIVAMTGDGVNDAPALKQADIGVAMGITGSEVAKDASSMILTDDNFATIVKAVENGRNIYKNIKSAIQFLLSGNFGAILTVLFASVANLPVPFKAVHLLFINLLTDSLPAIALGLEPHVETVMEEKPRPHNESILTKDFLAKIGTEGFVVGFLTSIAFLIGLSRGGADLGATMAFGTLCTARLVHGFNCKSDKPVIFKKAFWNNIYLIGAFLIGLILISGVLLIPGLKNVFDVVTLSWTEYGMVCGLAVLVLPIVQLLKWIIKGRK
ncbi:cation-translocating P-type ATPase [Faecalicatena sp. Marseille-Q4148]|nr:cation-translocating P-type ATPase [Faecalicatena sp. Marseille-Q4148]